VNVVLAHLQLTAYMVYGGTPLSPSHDRGGIHDGDTHSGTRGGTGLFDTFVHSVVRGAGWSTGSRIVHALPFGVVVALAVAGAVFFTMRRRGR
jgi:hypothetical protein